jgi:hypothetical protein
MTLSFHPLAKVFPLIEGDKFDTLVADIREHGVLELKAPCNRSTPAQLAFRSAINAAGGFAAEAVGLEAAIRVLESWGLLQGATQ